ncbi:hypothetical protein JCM8208_004218 [Rhodotorula glutinis]
MSARTRPARKSTASTFSYAEPPSSSDEDEDDASSESGRGGGGRKSRTKGPTKRPKDEAKSVEVDSGDEGDEDDQPRKKAHKPAKAKQSKQKKAKGKLEILKTLPVEMITEIFSHLFPSDLLALSMVNKQYRTFLTAKPSSRLWKAARDKLELPDLVTDNFGEIQYASLLFGGKCQLCNTGRAVKIEPGLRVRYCTSCRTQQIVELKSLERTHPNLKAKIHPRAQDVVVQMWGARSARTFSSKKWTTRQDEVSDDENDSASPYTRRVNEYVVARSTFFKEVKKDYFNLYHARRKAKAHLKTVKNEAAREHRSQSGGNRQQTLEREQERRAKKYAREALAMRQHDRQIVLRPLYDKLLTSMPRSARPFAPLYQDFLRLPSVKPLWVTGAIFAEQVWLDALDDIKDELEQFRLDLVAHAHSIVLEATTDPAEDPCAHNDDELPADLDTFFSRATSFVCCDFRHCQRPAMQNPWWLPRRSNKAMRDARREFCNIGPLVDVLKHLHEYHNKEFTILGQRPDKPQPQFHLSLPLEVACAVSALLEVNQLDPATAGLKDLERASKGVRKYVWDNRSSSWRNYTGERAWFDLLYTVKKEGDKLARLKPPIYLDPPVIVMHPIVGYRAPVDDQQEQLGESD